MKTAMALVVLIMLSSAMWPGYVESGEFKDWIAVQIVEAGD